MDPKDQAQEVLKRSGLTPGDRFRHYRGGLYEVVVCAIHEDTLEPLIVYRSLEKGTIWVRTLANWQESVAVDGQTVARFTRLSG